ncbi:MAG: methyltransferase domain-containing protein [Solirubrobacterales bacterium]|nr:methyltransferase domain-containing protein [Solirubrobacterales bacterium]
MGRSLRGRTLGFLRRASPGVESAGERCEDRRISTLQFDEDASRRIEATYTTPDVVEQRRVVRAALELGPGENVLDVGSGPGLLALEMAAEVGTVGSVDGVDPSESMLALSRGRPPAEGTADVRFVAGDACALPFAPERFDAAVATQVYEYVQDVPAALAEAFRVLRPGGRMLVLDTDWGSIVWRSGDAARMRRVLAAWDEHLVDPHLPQRLTGLLSAVGFSIGRRAAIPLLNAGYDPNTYSAGLIGFITAFVPGRQGLTEEDAEDWAEDLTALGDDYFFSLNRYLFLAVK